MKSRAAAAGPCPPPPQLSPHGAREGAAVPSPRPPRHPAPLPASRPRSRFTPAPPALLPQLPRGRGQDPQGSGRDTQPFPPGRGSVGGGNGPDRAGRHRREGAGTSPPVLPHPARPGPPAPGAGRAEPGGKAEPRGAAEPRAAPSPARSPLTSSPALHVGGAALGSRRLRPPPEGGGAEREAPRARPRPRSPFPPRP